MKRFICAFLFLLFCGQAWGATYYIDPDCGSPGTGATTVCIGAGAPFDSWASVPWVAGDVYLQKGNSTFAGKITIGGTGTEANPITMGSYGGSRAIINAAGESQGINSNGKAYITISDFSIIGAPTNNCIAIRSTSARVASGIRISNIDCMEAGGTCIGVTNNLATADYPGWGTGVVIDNVVVDSCGQHGIGIIGPYDGAIVKNSTASNTSEVASGWGIYVAGDSMNTSATDDAWTQDGQEWTIDDGDGLRTGINVTSVIYASTVSGTHWMTEDAALDDDWDWTHSTVTPSVTIRLPAGVTPNTGSGSSVVINYSLQPKNTVFRNNFCSEARNDDGVCIGADHGAENTTIKLNRVTGVDGKCYSFNANTGGQINNNIAEDCGEAGISVKHTSAAAVTNIYHNTINATGIATGVIGGGMAGSNVNVINNIIYGGTTGVEVSTTGYGTVTVDYNDITSSTMLGVGVTDGGHNITSDPLFVNTNTYYLKPGSPARDAALLSLIHDSTYTDYYGKKGTWSGFDLGAVEFYWSSGFPPLIFAMRGNKPTTLFAFAATDKYLIEGTTDCYLIEGTADCLLLE